MIKPASTRLDASGRFSRESWTMSVASDKVEDHYTSEGIAARILTALRSAAGDEGTPITPDTLAPLDHFHGRGLKATKEMVALLEPLSGERILDIGGGIGRSEERR